MKKSSILLIIALLPAFVHAQPSQRDRDESGPRPQMREGMRPGGPGMPGGPVGPGRPDMPQIDPETAQLMMLGRLIQMEPAQLDNLEAAITRVRQMSAREKLEVLAKIEELREERTSGAQDRTRQWQDIPEEARREYGRRLQEMSPEERAKHRESMRNLSPEERAERVRRSQP